MYEELIKEAEEEDIEVIDIDLGNSLKGLYCNNTIAINERITTYIEKACVLSEELGHYHTSTGDVLDQSKLGNRKQERLARAWGYERLVSIVDLIEAYNHGIKNRFELAEYLGVTEMFVDECVKHYKEKYGLCYEIDHYIIYFEPLGIFRKIF